MNPSQPMILTERQHNRRALHSSANLPTARLSHLTLCLLYRTEQALMLCLTLRQLMRPLLLRPGFWQRRNQTD